MTNVVSYIRVSTDEQAKGYSLPVQNDRIEKYCDIVHENLLRTFKEDYSAKTFDRPEFNKLLQYIKENPSLVNKLYVVRWDRFSRNATEAYAMIAKLRKLRVEVNAVEQPINTTIPEQKILLGFYLIAPEVENDRRALNTMAGMRRAMKEGRCVSTAPFGYKNSLNAYGKKVIEKTEKAKLVMEAYKLYAAGFYEKEEVRKRLRKKGLTLSKQSFAEMLSNPVYCGKIKLPAYMDESEQVVSGLHEAIVSEELFQQVQQVCFNRRQIKAKPKKQNDALPLRGNLVCSKCGKNLTGSVSTGIGGKYPYYHCQSPCDERIPAGYAHNSFDGLLKTFSVKPEIASLYLAVMEDIFKTEESDRATEISKLKQKRIEISETITKAGRKLVNDEIDKSGYFQVKRQLDLEALDISNRIRDLEDTESGFIEYSRYSLSFLSNLHGYYEQADFNVKQKIVSSIFPEKLSFSEGKYRTAKISEVLALLCKADKDSSQFIEETSAKNKLQSGKVARRRIELLFPP